MCVGDPASIRADSPRRFASVRVVRARTAADATERGLAAAKVGRPSAGSPAKAGTTPEIFPLPGSRPAVNVGAPEHRPPQLRRRRELEPLSTLGVSRRVSADRFGVHFTADAELRDLLERAAARPQNIRLLCRSHNLLHARAKQRSPRDDGARTTLTRPGRGRQNAAHSFNRSLTSAPFSAVGRKSILLSRSIEAKRAFLISRSCWRCSREEVRRLRRHGILRATLE